jgi:hypothetical protein
VLAVRPSINTVVITTVGLWSIFVGLWSIGGKLVVSGKSNKVLLLLLRRAYKDICHQTGHSPVTQVTIGRRRVVPASPAEVVVVVVVVVAKWKIALK